MEEQAIVTKPKGVVSYSHREVAGLLADRELAVEYLKAVMAGLDNPDDRGACVVAHRAVAEAYGDLGQVANAAGVSREPLYQALSPRDNPTLKPLLALLKSVGMRLSVEPEQHATA